MRPGLVLNVVLSNANLRQDTQWETGRRPVHKGNHEYQGHVISPETGQHEGYRSTTRPCRVIQKQMLVPELPAGMQISRAGKGPSQNQAFLTMSRTTKDLSKRDTANYICLLWILGGVGTPDMNELIQEISAGLTSGPSWNAVSCSDGRLTLLGSTMLSSNVAKIVHLC